MGETILEELVFCDRWLSDEYKNSIEYREYLDEVNKQLKNNTSSNLVR